MKYKILELHAKYDGDKLEEVSVLFEVSPGDTRATICTNKPRGGYKFLSGHEILNENLIQEVAASGMEMSYEQALKYFTSISKN